MIVIGDAAHAPAPSSGQGASMAMEDGVLLAMALRDAPSIDEAFTSFELVRRERVERIVAQGARSSSSKTPGRIGSAIRDVVLRLVFRYAVTERSMAWMYDARIPLGPTPRRAAEAGLPSAFREPIDRLTASEGSAMLRRPLAGSRPGRVRAGWPRARRTSTRP